MSRRLTAIVLAGALLLAGCAYYNTFYYAREYYKDAERKRADVEPERRPTVGLDLYEKSMKKCAKVIVEYPGSKWVDDAILLMGKCMYAKGDYLAALGKFKEVKRYYEKGGNVEEAEFYRARTLVALERYDEAVAVLDHFREKGDKKWRDEAVYLYATVEYQRERYDEAADGFSRFLGFDVKGERRDRALYLLGDSYRRTGEYEKAYRAFEERLEDALLPQEERLKTSLDLTDVLIEEGKFDEAYRALEDIRKDVRGREDSLKIDYRLGRGLLAEGRTEEAVEVYRTALKDAPSSETAADMAFSLGTIYLDRYGQKDSAAAAFRMVTSHPARPEVKEQASRSSMALNEYIRLREEYVADGADTARIQFLLAETELFQFGEVDSAYRRYDLVASQFMESSFAPKALAAEIYLIDQGDGDSTERDGILHRLVRRYPRSKQAVEYVDRGEIEVDEDSLARWIEEYDAIYGAPTEPEESPGVVALGRLRIFPGEGEVEVPREPKPVFGPPGPLRLLKQAEPDYPRIPAGEKKPDDEVKVEVEVEVDGLGRVRDAWVVDSDSRFFEGPALAAAYLSRYREDGAEENRRAILKFRFRPGPGRRN